MSGAIWADYLHRLGPVEPVVLGAVVGILWPLVINTISEDRLGLRFGDRVYNGSIAFFSLLGLGLYGNPVATHNALVVVAFSLVSVVYGFFLTLVVAFVSQRPPHTLPMLLCMSIGIATATHYFH